MDKNIGHLQDVDFTRNGSLNTQEIGSGNLPVLIMVYGSYCGHCKTAKPDFERVARDFHNKGIFICALMTDDKDPKTKKLMTRFPQILDGHKISFSGVPTYLLWKNGKLVEYEGGRDYNSIVKFLMSIGVPPLK
jgi:thiol-disulfide isomerase/thioredoxin